MAVHPYIRAPPTLTNPIQGLINDPLSGPPFHTQEQHPTTAPLAPSHPPLPAAPLGPQPDSIPAAPSSPGSPPTDELSAQSMSPSPALSVPQDSTRARPRTRAWAGVMKPKHHTDGTIPWPPSRRLLELGDVLVVSSICSPSFFGLIEISLKSIGGLRWLLDIKEDGD
ncbi:hypothetical protein NE237_031011 [Protea cynaroides]|uniref:Uncharacterized protein n=1 Tax=Protea cynaroides TaxID=273540 RepID=A0A9Q0GV73_9MAGN|nr:hypothetical protein NE237_031011 [Protea cynaroides]